MRPTPNAAVGLLTLVGMAALLTGCLIHAPTLDPIRLEMERVDPAARFEPGVQLKLGRLSMALVRSITRAAIDGEEDPEAREMARLLRHVKGVEVAVYQIERLGSDSPSILSRELADLGQRRGWRLAARVQEEDDLVWVHYQEKRGAIKNVYVFVLDEESLILARFKGNLEKAIADAIALQGRRLPDAVVEAAGP